MSETHLLAIAVGLDIIGRGKSVAVMFFPSDVASIVTQIGVN